MLWIVMYAAIGVAHRQRFEDRCGVLAPQARAADVLAHVQGTEAELARSASTSLGKCLRRSQSSAFGASRAAANSRTASRMRVPLFRGERRVRQSCSCSHVLVRQIDIFVIAR
jgi:hypothetical protein